MAESLFDSRYRYDYIYPRGRSGETLRAIDTESNRLVVIKRPAPNDAPPIRAGQEVSILNERKALTRLAGQPALTALVGGGQFSVGGTAHQYIVVERAEGDIVAETVLELAARGERLPELEMLVIIDSLLALLSAAHAQDIVYNDVDAKHLFWDRTNYRLKVIDWGNAVFLEGDEITPQGISRQSDIFQVGELLYFILTGGGRIDMPRDAGDDFRVDFGADAERTHTRLQSITSRAVHPNPKLRYRTIDELRNDLAEYRAPLERERNAIIGRVNERLRRDRSRDELTSLLRALEPALAMDPGYPPAHETRNEILNRLSDLEVAADLDAARIYLESGNWSRAVDLLDELRGRARGDLSTLIALLLDWAHLLYEHEIRPAPPAVKAGVGLLFDGDAAGAAQRLLAGDVSSDAVQRVQWLLAERISAHVPDVLLLRPNLYRLHAALERLSGENIPLGEPRAILGEIIEALDDLPSTASLSLSALRDRYRMVVDRLAALGTLLEAVNSTYQFPNRVLPLTSLERASNAAMALADNMHVVGKQATASPRDALEALDNSRAIDQTTPVWDIMSKLLNGLYELLQSYQTYVPTADGSDLEGWLKATQSDLEPFVERLFDEMLAGIVAGLRTAEKAWQTYAAAVIQGNRIGAITALAQATDAVGTVSPTLAGWLNQLRTIVTNASYIERHALYGGLGRALADGWEAYDRGRLADAERLGGQALEIARNDAERFAARRLHDLAEQTRGWVERGGVNDAKRTQDTLTQVELLYTADENTTRNSFASQMPSKETYLKAMGKGLVELYSRHSTAAPRILFFNYILLGTLDAHEGLLEDTAFWREAANKTMGENASKHPAARTLDEYVQRRIDLTRAEEVLSRINGRHALPTLEQSRRVLEENAQAKSLTAAIYSLRELETSLRDWSDGEFRAAGIKLENALKALDDVEAQANITVTNMRAWLMELVAAAADLHTTIRGMTQIIEGKPSEPQEAVRAAHHKLVDVTVQMLGDAYAGTLRGWRDTYEAFLGVYTGGLRRSMKLTRFNELFRAMFIDRHPAYPLYRHWYDVTEQAPEFPAPPTDEPTPRLAEGDEEPEPVPSRYVETPERERRRGSRLPLLLIGAVVLIAVTAAVLIISRQPQVTPSDDGGTTTQGGAGGESTEVAVVLAITDEVTTEPAATETSEPTRSSGFTVFTPVPQGDVPTSLPLFDNTTTPISRALPTTIPPTEAASATPEPTATETPTETWTPEPTATSTPTTSPTPRPTLPPGGLIGSQDLLAVAQGIENPPWTSDQFLQSEAGVWRLGSGGESAEGGEVIVIPLPPEILESFFGNNAAARVTSVEATMALTTYVPSLVAEGEVYFGAVLASADDPTRTIGLQVVLNQPGIINLGRRQGADVQMVSQRSVSAVVVRIRLVRDPVTGIVSVFYNNEQIGQPVLFVAPDSGVVPVLFVRGGGVIVSVTDWTVTLRE